MGLKNDKYEVCVCRGCVEQREGVGKKVFWNGDDSLLAAHQTDGGKETRFFHNLFHSRPTVPFGEQLQVHKNLENVCQLYLHVYLY